jgi:hypothetical protein
MSAAAIRAFGVITFVFEAALLFVLIGQRSRLGPFPMQFTISIAVFFFTAALIGVGLLFLRKWAAIVFSLALVALPIWNAIDTFGKAPFAWHLIVLASAIVLVMPVIIIIRSWPLLSWGGKWFL